MGEESRHVGAQRLGGLGYVAWESWRSGMAASHAARLSAYIISCKARLTWGWRRVGSLSNTVAIQCTPPRGFRDSGQTSRTAALQPEIGRAENSEGIAIA